ncbi:MAG: hypothetical protein WBP13_08055 [Methylophilaceae bacterium]
MSLKIRLFILLLAGSLIVSSITACVSNNKTIQNMAIYDFGLSNTDQNNQQITSKILIEELVVAESLNNNKIRYRLNYQNPSRIYFYTESRWASAPSALFSSRLNAMATTVQNPLSCSLKLKLEAFDHVFQTVTASEGVVQLSVQLVEKKSRRIISSQLISESIPSSSPNAKGGTTALRQASEVAIKNAVHWGNVVAEESIPCH